MIVKAIDNYLIGRKRDERRKHCFHPSSLHKGVKELYRIYFDGDSGGFPPNILRVFDNGHGVHERLQGYLTACGVLLHSEYPVMNEDYEIYGTCDGIVMIEGKRGVLEIKSINHDKFEKLDGPLKEHLEQVHVYMFCLGIKRAVLLYEDKNNQALKEYYVGFSWGVISPILDKIRLVQSWTKSPPAGLSKVGTEKDDIAQELLEAF